MKTKFIYSNAVYANFNTLEKKRETWNLHILQKRKNWVREISIVVKIRFSLKDLFSQSGQINSFTFTKENFEGKIHFLFSDFSIGYIFIKFDLILQVSISVSF